MTLTDTTSVVIFGGGGHALAVRGVLSDLGMTVSMFVDSNEDCRCARLNIPVLSEEAIDWRLLYSANIIVAIADNAIRQKIVELIESKIKDPFFFSAIHPAAEISSTAVIGHGVVVFPNSVIGESVFIGNHACVNTGVVIEHDSKISEFVFTGPNATICGDCTLGANSFIGAGTVLIEKIRVGDRFFAAAGSVVVTNFIGQEIRVKGIPARIY